MRIVYLHHLSNDGREWMCYNFGRFADPFVTYILTLTECVWLVPGTLSSED